MTPPIVDSPGGPSGKSEDTLRASRGLSCPFVSCCGEDSPHWPVEVDPAICPASHFPSDSPAASRVASPCVPAHPTRRCADFFRDIKHEHGGPQNPRAKTGSWAGGVEDGSASDIDLKAAGGRAP